jgi:hypothetical protein
MSDDETRADSDRRGMRWWNSLSDKDRRFWMTAAGETGRIIDVWEFVGRKEPK